MRNILWIVTIVAVCSWSPSISQKRKSNNTSEEKSILESTSLSGLKFRSLGPALTSGRISDFAINPENPKEYYVATSSGGVWKTINSGTTFTPLFDSQGSYSIGCVTLDPRNPNVVWVGTGENNGQRSVAYGDGIYKSEDGGKSWKNMGLKSSEHIGSIIVHPDNSDVIYVAAIGPLWSSGGERGIYKSTDGGETWRAVLTIDEHTGVDNIVMDPRNPRILYAAAYQRARHVYTYLGGGPKSGLYKSVDGGETWNEINNGLPGVDKGRIGLAISPANPEIIYAIVEAAQGKGGFYRSTDRGASWHKRGGFSTAGLYYQEIFADPVDAEKIYAMDTWMKVSLDGGKTFKNVGEDFKHVDNHAMWINPEDPDHILNGNDGGIYETWDGGKTWDFKANLPVIQFYKVEVDNDAPFYNIYGGTQDNFSLGGPSRSVSGNGIQNTDWYITHGGDGFESQIDPKNPDIVYAQSQYGVLVRYDRKSGEEKGIQPKERKDENSYRWNWDAPLATSLHKDGRVYFAANKLFKSDDRGDSWEVISDDLTRQLNRNELPIMGRVWGIDAVAKNQSTSPYGTIVAFSESPINENLLIVGTDDGLIQITEDGGNTWRKIDNIPGVPSQTYVNMVIASQHDENVIYACFNHHKYGNFSPYVYMSSDKGNSWKAIQSNLPERGSAYAIAEDHVDKNLLFVGTEFGAFFTNDSGNEWKQLNSGLPTVAVRDIAIQRRENDLVLATFGRGFYVLDDYSVLRNIGNETLSKEAELFTLRDPLLFELSYPLGLPGKSFQGDSYYLGDNLPSVAMFTYYLKEGIKTKQEKRRETEKENAKNGKGNQYPSYESLKEERVEEKPYLLFTITDASGNIVRKLTTTPSKGLNRLHWDLRYAPKDPISLSKSSFYNPFAGKSEGTLVMPGTYSVVLEKSVDGEITKLAGPVSFNVKSLNNTVLPATDRDALVAFQKEVADLSRSIQGAQKAIGELKNQVKHMREAVKRVEVPHNELMTDIISFEQNLNDLQVKLNGDPVAATLDIGTPPAPATRVGWIMYEQFYSTSAPTKTHRDSYAIAKEEYDPIKTELKKMVEVDLVNILKKLDSAGAPYTPNSILEFTEF